MCSLYAEQLHQPRAHQVIWIVDRDAFGARSRPTDDGDRAGAHPERGGERTAYGLIGPAVHGGRGHRDHEGVPAEAATHAGARGARPDANDELHRAHCRGLRWAVMDCHYYDAGVCRSCTLMGTPYERQLADKQSVAAQLLAEHVGPTRWSEPFDSRESGFRNKAKLVVGGRPGEITLGILDATQTAVDLSECGLYEPGLQAAFAPLAHLIEDLRLLPYDVRKARGELKNLLVTHSPSGELMVRFVLRSERQAQRIADAVPAIGDFVDGVAVVSINLQPEHKAILEGPHERVLTARQSLSMELGQVRLHLRPNSFFQTNTDVAIGLYHQAQQWISQVAPDVVWDLYCGVGGFSLYAGAPGRRIFGAEISADAIASARQSASELAASESGGVGSFTFAAGDAAVMARDAGWPGPDLVIVNPPRRGIDARLAADLESSGASFLLYSSCNPVTLARDLTRLPSFHVEQARLFDMFPQTGHSEVLVLLQR